MNAIDQGANLMNILGCGLGALLAAFVVGAVLSRGRPNDNSHEERREPDAGGTGFTGALSDCQMGELNIRK